MIFETVRKPSGGIITPLSIPEIKQIGGRAGRYKSAFQATQEASKRAMPHTVGSGTAQLTVADTSQTSVVEAPPNAIPEQRSMGLVTTLEKEDYTLVANSMVADSPPLTSAGILPPAPVVQRFCSYFPPGTPFSYIMLRLHEIAKIGSRYHLCRISDIVVLADIIEDIKGLTPEDRLIICQAPVATREAPMREWIKILSACIDTGRGGGLLELEDTGIELLDAPVRGNREYLRSLETLHKKLIAYLWLSYRFAGVFTTRSLAMHTKELVEKKIEESLDMFNFSETSRKRKQQLMREQELLHALEMEADSTAGQAEIADGQEANRYFDPTETEEQQESALFDSTGETTSENGAAEITSTLPLSLGDAIHPTGTFETASSDPATSSSQTEQPASSADLMRIISQQAEQQRLEPEQRN